MTHYEFVFLTSNVFTDEQAFGQNSNLLVVYYVDIDECATNNGGCDVNSDCVNSCLLYTSDAADE